MCIGADYTGDMLTQAFGVRVRLPRFVQIMPEQGAFAAPFVNRDANTGQRHGAQKNIQNNHTLKMGFPCPILKPGAALC